MNLIAKQLKKIIKQASLNSLQEDLKKENVFYNNYLQYTEDNPQEIDRLMKRWWKFTNKYDLFYVYSFPEISNQDYQNIRYGRVECTSIREKGHNDEITLSLLYDCGIGNENYDGTNVIGHLGLEGGITNLINNVKDYGYTCK